MTLSSKATSNAIFGVVHPILGNALLARTAAEVLYWLQHAVHELDGKAAIYKTGPELADELGISARTANTHLKKLAAIGLWTLDYRPRPFGGISPVTWVSPERMAWAIIARALDVSAEEQRHRKERRTDERGRRERRSTASEIDTRMSVTVTSLQKDIQTDRQTDHKTNFIHSSRDAEERMNFSDFGREKIGEEREENVTEEESEQKNGENHHSSMTSNELDKNTKKLKLAYQAPTWLTLTEEEKCFVNLTQSYLEQDPIYPPWDMSSKYTWIHGKDFYVHLRAQGLAKTYREMSAAVITLLCNWYDYVKALPDRYQKHPENETRPSPMALGTFRKQIVQQLKISSETGEWTHEKLFEGVCDFNELELQILF